MIIIFIAIEASQKLAFIKSCKVEDLWLEDLDKLSKYYEKKES